MDTNTPAAVGVRLLQLRTGTARLLLTALVGLLTADVTSAAKPSPAQREYDEIARLLSYSYELGGRRVVAEPRDADLARIADSAKQEATRTAAELLSESNRKADAQSLLVEDGPHRRALAAKAGYEAEIRKQKQIIAENYSSPNVVALARSRMASAERQLRSWKPVPPGPRNPILRAENRATFADQSRPVGWNGSLLDLPAKFAGPLSKQKLVEVRYVPIKNRPNSIPGEYVRKGYFEARNTSGRNLNHVTLAVDLHHYTTTPTPSLRHVYYVPHWKRGATLKLADNYAYVRTKENIEYHEWLDDLQRADAIVRATTTVWSDESRQSPTSTDFPDRAEAVAGELVKLAESRITSPVAHIEWKLAIGKWMKIVPKLVPANSELAKRAKRIESDFDGVRAELLGKKLANEDKILLSACAKGKKYVGRWSGSTPWVQSALQQKDFGVLFVECDAKGTRIRAEVFHPQKPELRRLLTGFVAEDRRTQKRIIMLEPLDPDRGHDESGILHELVKSYRFWLSPAGMTAQASTKELPLAPYDPSPLRLILKSAAADQKMLAAATKRNDAARIKKPRTTPEDLNPTRVPTELIPTLRQNPALVPKPTTPPNSSSSAAEKRAEAIRKAQQQRAALTALTYGKQAMARRNLPLAERYFKQVIEVAPDSRVARTAERLLKQVESRKK